MKIRSMHVLLVLMLAFSLQACNLGSPPPASESGGTEASATTVSEPTAEMTEAPTEASPAETATACSNTYLPVVVGATWDYKMTGLAEDTYTHTVLTAEGNGFTEQDVFSVGVTRQGKWTCENGNLIALNPPSGSSGTVQTDNNVQVNLETKELTGITLPAQINAGDTWSQSMTLEGTETINGQEFPARNVLKSDCTALGVESVTVAAGTFDAMHVECKTSMQITVTIGGSDTGTTLDLTGNTWYAGNVGMVRSVTSGFGQDSIIELVSYNIPQ